MNNRLDSIRALLLTRKVRSQEELIGLLAAQGIRATQATLSRDLKKLGVSKQRDAAGDSCYVLPDAPGKPADVRMAEGRASESILSLAMSGQMGVIKTLPGCAGMVGAVVDNHTYPDLMGTIAGDDTLLLILRQDAPHDGFLDFLAGFIPGIENKYLH